MNYRGPPAFSLSTSLKRSISEMPKREDVSPGPIYDHEKEASSHMKRTTSIGRSKRTAVNHGVQATPPPNLYEVDQQPNIYRITFPKYQPANPEKDVPPIGSHYPNHDSTQPKPPTYSMGQKYPSIMTSTNMNPGPGSYQIHQSLRILRKSYNKSQNKFGSASRFKLYRDRTPGVGDYSSWTLSKLKNQKASLPRAQKFKVDKQILPGPGEYLVTSQFSEKGQKGKSLSSRLRSLFQVTSDTTIAFGKYQKLGSSSLLQKSIKITFPKQKRQSHKQDDFPAPTDYINDAFQTKNSFSTHIPHSQRRQYNDTLKFPGPGTYHVKSQVGRMAQFGRSKSTSVTGGTPGPGRYQAKMLQRGRKGSLFGVQRKGVLKVANPAPVGAYQLSQDILRKKGSFSKSERFGQQVERQPGPGDYRIHDIIHYHLNTKSSPFKRH